MLLSFKNISCVSTDGPLKSVEKRESEGWVDYILRQDNITAFLYVLKNAKLSKHFFASKTIQNKDNVKPKIIILDDNHKQVIKMKNILFEYFKKDLKNYLPRSRRVPLKPLKFIS